MRASNKLLAGGAVVLAMSIALPAISQQNQSAQNLGMNPNAPLEIASDGGGGYIEATCTTTLNGNAQVTQDKVRIVGRSIVARQRKQAGKCGDFDRIEVDKDVFFVRPDGTVRADHAVYDVAAATVVFTGQVIVVRGDNVMTGTKLTFNTKTNDSTMEGPVRALVMPQAKPAA